LSGTTYCNSGSRACVSSEAKAQRIVATPYTNQLLLRAQVYIYMICSARPEFSQPRPAAAVLQLASTFAEAASFSKRITDEVCFNNIKQKCSIKIICKKIHPEHRHHQSPP
jgi:hypothetical protein